MPLTAINNALAMPAGELAALLDSVAAHEVSVPGAAAMLTCERDRWQPCAPRTEALAEAIIGYIAVAQPYRRNWTCFIALATAAASADPFDAVLDMFFEMVSTEHPACNAHGAWRSFRETTTSAEARACAIDLVCAVRERALGVKVPAGARA